MAHSEGRPRGTFTVFDRAALASAAALVLMSLIGSLLTIGDRLAAVGPALGAVFYTLVVVLIAAGVVYPLVKIAAHPVFSLYLLRKENGQADRRRCRSLINGISRNVELSEDERVRLESARDAGDEIDELTISFYRDVLVPRMKAEVKSSAKAVFFATAISRSSLVDTFTMASISLRLVQSVVAYCGFRPCFPSLMKLYAKIMVTALVAGGIEELDLDELIANLMGGAAGARVSGALFASVTQGTVNAFLMYRIGSMTIGYLCSEEGPARLSALKQASYKEAMRMMETSGLLNDISEFVKEGTKTVFQAATSATKQTAVNVGKSAIDAVSASASKFGDAIKGAASKVTGHGNKPDTIMSTRDVM